MNTLGPLCVRHIGPFVFVEARSAGETSLVDIQREALVLGIESQRGPWHREQLAAHAEEAAEGQYRIGHSTGAHVQHDFLDVTEVVAVLVVDITANKSLGPHQVRAGSVPHVRPGNDVRFVHAIRVALYIVHSCLHSGTCPRSDGSFAQEHRRQG